MIYYSNYSDWFSDIERWLKRIDSQRAHETFLVRNVIKPIFRVFRSFRRRIKPLLVRRLPMWSTRRWKSVT